jgi:hypothetical protein
MVIPFLWTSVVVHETWLESNRDLAYRYVKAVTEAVSFMKRNRAESERIISKYMKLTDPNLVAIEYDFNVALFPNLPYPTLDGMRLILENLAIENPEHARRDPKEFVDSSIVDRLKQEKFLESVGKIINDPLSRRENGSVSFLSDSERDLLVGPCFGQNG